VTAPIQPQPSRPGRWLPAGLLAFAALAGTLRIRSVDFFWHLVAGRWILDHGGVPRHDPFRFTSASAPWVDHEWLFQAVIATADALGGISALVALRALLVVSLAVVLLVTLRRSGCPGAPPVALAAVALLGARARFFLRPELASVLALALLLALLQELRRVAAEEPSPDARPSLYRSSRRLPVLASTLLVLVVGWANLHPGALVAPVLVAAYLVGHRLPGGHRSRGSRPPLPWSWVAALPLATGAALLATPYGHRIFLVPLEIGRALRGLPGVNPDWATAWQAPRPFFFAGVAAVIAGAVVAWRRRALDPATGLVTLATVVLATVSARHQPLFFVAGTVFAGEVVARLDGEEEGAELVRGVSSPRTVGLVWVLLVLSAAWILAPPSRGPLRPRRSAPRFGWGVQGDLFPAAAVDRVAELDGELGPIYNAPAFGGYLLWHLFPDRKVFVDTRNEVDPGLLRQIGDARGDSRRWRQLLAEFDVDGALVGYDERPRPVVEPGEGGGLVVGERTTSALLFPRPEFALVFWDDVSLLFVRRTPQRRSWLAEAEYRYLQPEDWRASLRSAAKDPAFRRGLLRELRRRLEESPPSRRAAELLRRLGGDPLRPGG
jgi:hypothetical protein